MALSRNFVFAKKKEESQMQQFPSLCARPLGKNAITWGCILLGGRVTLLMDMNLFNLFSI